MAHQIDRRPTVSVPCDGCTACCRHDIIFLHPECGDKAVDYLTDPATNPLTGNTGRMLQRKPNGDCIYLGATGCTIHGRAPVICREFDCRRLYLKVPREERRKLIALGYASKDVFMAGRKRVRTLPEFAK